jgi:NADH dehydrogenase
VAVADVARILEAAAIGDPRLTDRTIAVLGPEEMTLGSAVRRVAIVAGRRPWFVRLPVTAHLVIARIAEWTMRVPLVSTAQVRILAEGVVEPAPFADPPPADLAPDTPLDAETIRRGLPPPARFGLGDLRWCARPTA